MTHRFSRGTVFERSPVLDHFGVLDSDTKQFVPVEISDLIDRANYLVLPSTVPEALQKMYTVAKGAYVYGWCFYPLFAVAIEHCYKILEAGVRHKYRELGGPQGKPSFRRQVEWLRGRGIIPIDEVDVWSTAVHLRNLASHPDGQTIMMPDDALQFLHMTVLRLTTLFPREGAVSGATQET